MDISSAAVAKQAKEHLPLIIKSIRWLQVRRYPRAPRGTLGLAVAIVTENDEQRRQFKMDFLDTVEHLLAETQLRTPLSLVALENHHSSKIKTVTNARKVLAKTGCVFLLAGRIRNRKVRGEDNFVLDVDSVVRHGFISEEISKRFSIEMRELLPVRRQISRQNELSEFEINAAAVELAVRYVIGVAAHLSGQLDLSIEIFEALAERLKQTKMNDSPPQVRESIRSLQLRVPLQLSALHFSEAGRILLRWRKTRSDDDLSQVMDHASRGERYRPGAYQAALLRALCHFVRDRDIREARKELAPFKKARLMDATWAVDEAFLLAYSGDLNGALRNYRTAIKRIGADSSTLLEVEEFILWVLSEEPDKVQLHFCLGLINYWGKRDLKKAKEDFEGFLDSTEQGSLYGEQREFVRQCLAEIANK